MNDEAKPTNQPTPAPNNDPGFSKEPGEEMNVGAVHDSILREQADPEDGYEPIPLWLVTIIMVVVFWSGLYLAYHSGGFRSDVFDPTLVSWTGQGAAQKETGPPDPMVLGRRIFSQNCIVCHQATGLGVPGQFPPLAGSEWVLSQDWHGDNHLVKILLHGLQGEIQVKGNTYNNAMPAQRLNDSQIAAVLTYIRNEWGNSAPPISEEFVARVRQETTSRTEPWTQNDLKAIPRELDSTTPPPPEAAPQEAQPGAPADGSASAPTAAGVTAG